MCPRTSYLYPMTSLYLGLYSSCVAEETLREGRHESTQCKAGWKGSASPSSLNPDIWELYVLVLTCLSVSMPGNLNVLAFQNVFGYIANKCQSRHYTPH